MNRSAQPGHDQATPHAGNGAAGAHGVAPAHADDLFRAMVENAPDMISVIDTEGHLTFTSPQLERELGYRPDEIDVLGEQYFHPDDYPAVVDAFTQLVAEGGRRQLPDHRMRRKNGQWVWVQTHATNMLDDPRVNGILMVSRDVTDQKRRDAEMLQAEKSVGFGHWRWDKGAPGPEWSDGMFTLLGLDKHAMPGDMAWTLDLMSEDDYQVIIEEVMAALTEGAPLNRVISMRHADGSTRRVLVMGHVERDAEGEPTTILGVSQDVTQLEEAHDAIQKSEQEFRLLAEHSTDAIARYSADGQVLYISPSVERILGYPAEECIGLFSNDFLHPDDLRAVVGEITSMYADGQMRRTAFRMRARDGSYVWLESAMSPLFDQTGKVDGFVACTRDVTAQKKHEQELMAARERAEQANLTKSRFLANMSHELRTPLNAILGFSEMMTQKVFGELGAPQYEEYAGMIHESGSHLLSLIGDILDLSKIEAGKYDLSLEAVDVEDAVRKAARMVMTRVREGGLTLGFELSGARGASVRADSRALTQMLLNLLSNAVKFTPEGGRISVSALPAGQGRLAISIADTGIGIAPEDMERVIHPFEQVERHAELASQGTGLGLPLVRALVELHDGAFRIASEPGRGTSVTIELPLAGAALSASA